MNKNSLALALATLILIAGSVGFAVSQLLVQKSLTATVTIKASAGLTFLDGDGKTISTLSYGEIALGVWVGKTIVVKNVGNVPLSLTCARVDSTTGISTNFAYPDGTWFQPSVGKPLPVGGSISVVIEVRCDAAPPGEYNLEFVFTGSG